MTKNIKTDVLRVCAGNFILGAVTVLVFAVIRRFSLPVVWGALLGNAFVCLSFFWLAVSVSKNVEKDPENARKRVSATYTYRLLAMAAMVVVAIKLPMFNHIAAVAPLFYQRLVITAVGKLRIKEDSKKEVAEN
jgi:hypothetical protein